MKVAKQIGIISDIENLSEVLNAYWRFTHRVSKGSLWDQ